MLTTSNRYSVNGIPGLGLNRFAVCSGSRFREQPGFQSNPSLLPPERRCEEERECCLRHKPISQRSYPMTPLRRCMTEDMQVRNFSPHTQNSYVQQVSLFARLFVMVIAARKAPARILINADLPARFRQEGHAPQRPAVQSRPFSAPACRRTIYGFLSVGALRPNGNAPHLWLVKPLVQRQRTSSRSPAMLLSGSKWP